MMQGSSTYTTHDPDSGGDFGPAWHAELAVQDGKRLARVGIDGHGRVWIRPTGARASLPNRAWLETKLVAILTRWKPDRHAVRDVTFSLRWLDASDESGKVTGKRDAIVATLLAYVDRHTGKTR